MIILAALLILLSPLSAWAAPFLVSDPAADKVESCVLEGMELPCALSPDDGSIHVDMAPLQPGSYTIRAKYCVEKGLWCSEWSDPFAFTKPSIPLPAKIGLSK